MFICFLSKTVKVQVVSSLNFKRIKETPRVSTAWSGILENVKAWEKVGKTVWHIVIWQFFFSVRLKSCLLARQFSIRLPVNFADLSVATSGEEKAFGAVVVCVVASLLVRHRLLSSLVFAALYSGSHSRSRRRPRTVTALWLSLL